jgi:hypothetical protein
MRTDFIGETVALLRRATQRFGPYVLIEIVLPGGTLLALLLLAWRRSRRRRYSSRGDDRVSSRGRATACDVAPTGASALEAAMTAFVDRADAASSSRSASSRKIGANRCAA